MKPKSLINVHLKIKEGSKIRFCFDTQAKVDKVENLVTLYNKLISKEKEGKTISHALNRW